MNRRGARLAHPGGFALVGLLVVIAIAAAVGAGAVLATHAMTRRSQLAVCETDARTIRAAVEADRARHGRADRPSMGTLVARGFLPRPTRHHAMSYAGSTLQLRPLGACAGRAYTP